MESRAGKELKGLTANQMETGSSKKFREALHHKVQVITLCSANQLFITGI